MIAALLLVAALPQEPIGSQEPVSFEREVLPLLRARCAGCHRPDERKGDLDLTSHAALIAGGSSGPVVLPGDEEGSLLLDLVSPYEGASPEMPPADKGEPLDTIQRERIARWIREGARDDTPEWTVPDTPPRYLRLPVVTDLVFSPDGKHLAVTGRGEVLLHDVSLGKPIARLVGASSRIEGLAYSPDGSRLAVVGGTPGVRGELQLWDVSQREQLQSIAIAYDTLYGVSWSMDGTRVAFGGPDRALRALDARTGAQVLFQMSHEDWVLDTVWSTDDSHLISVSRDRSMKLVQVSSQQFIDNITSITPGALKGGLMAVARHPERDELLVGGADGVPKIYRMYREKKRQIGDDFNKLRAFEALSGRVYDVAYSTAGDRIVAVSSHVGGGEVRVGIEADGSSLWSRELDSGQYCATFDPAGTMVATSGFDGVVRLFDATTGEPRVQFDAAPLESTNP